MQPRCKGRSSRALGLLAAPRIAQECQQRGKSGHSPARACSSHGPRGSTPAALLVASRSQRVTPVSGHRARLWGTRARSHGGSHAPAHSLASTRPISLPKYLGTCSICGHAHTCPSCPFRCPSCRAPILPGDRFLSGSQVKLPEGQSCRCRRRPWGEPGLTLSPLAASWRVSQAASQSGIGAGVRPGRGLKTCVTTSQQLRHGFSCAGEGN